MEGGACMPPGRPGGGAIGTDGGTGRDCGRGGGIEGKGGGAEGGFGASVGATGGGPEGGLGNPCGRGGGGIATPAGAAGSGARTGLFAFAPDTLPLALAGPSLGRFFGSTASTSERDETSRPKTSGRVPARRVKFAMISVSDALLVSLILESIASRCSFHLGSISPMRMCSCISECRMSSPVRGDTTYSVGSYSCPSVVLV
jgi:hypothetical protein